MSTPVPEPGLDALEAALRGLKPSAGRLDRDALMFLAGRASLSRRWLGPAAAAALASVASVLSVLWLIGPRPAGPERIVYVRPDTGSLARPEYQPFEGGSLAMAPADRAGANAWSCLRMEELVARAGVEALAEPSLWSAEESVTSGKVMTVRGAMHDYDLLAAP